MSWTSLVIEKSLPIAWQVCNTTHLLITFIYLYPFIRWLKISSNKECLSDLNLYEAVKSPGLVAQLKLKCFLMKSTHDDIIEAKFTFNCLLEDIKGS